MLELKLKYEVKVLSNVKEMVDRKVFELWGVYSKVLTMGNCNQEIEIEVQ